MMRDLTITVGHNIKRQSSRFDTQKLGVQI